ncbi:MAG TPA: hypothetical protein VNN72_08315 [Polyangiaceae bacterium]|nr:hypothetical protein [Polyangiaceae bacterium]
MARDPIRLTELPGGAPLFQNAHLSFRCDHAQGIVVAVRTPLAFQHVEEIEATTAALVRTFPVERRKGFTILSDFREGPVRVHPALEPAFTRYRDETMRGFLRGAVIVGTTLGRIRGDRLGDSAPIPLLITESVEEALAFMRAPPKRGQ